MCKVNALELILLQNKTWLENAKQDLWIQRYNLESAKKRCKVTEIVLYQTRIESIEHMMKNFHCIINLINDERIL